MSYRPEVGLGLAHARNAEKLITLTAMPAYDPINTVKIILIISYPMDVWVIKACFWSSVNPVGIASQKIACEMYRSQSVSVIRVGS